ncbi:hypothetical protein [Rhizobium freirei]|nr:hypothetical protein [Rhizobium freirei]
MTNTSQLDLIRIPGCITLVIQLPHDNDCSPASVALDQFNAAEAA